MQNVQILRKVTTWKYWSAGTIEKYWNPWTTICTLIQEI